MVEASPDNSATVEPTIAPSRGRRKYRAAAAVLLAIQAALLAYAATRHSPTFNEPGHLVAGISHWEFGRFELYRVNPPLSHMVAAVPVLAAGAEYDWQGFYESAGARPIFSMGKDFVAANGERTIWLFTLARWVCIPFSLLGGYICFRWATDLYGDAAGLFALALWCFSPNILAHGELVTPDMSATALGLTAGYFFWRWLRSPTWLSAVVAGALLGLAELTKFTWLILFGLWPLLWCVWLVFPRRSAGNHHRFLVQGSQLALQLLLAIYVINLGYAFEGSGTKLRDFAFVSNTFKGPDAEVTGAVNRFTGTWLENIPVPLPKNMIAGIDVQRQDFEDFGRPSYLRGTYQKTGWWYYYLYAAAIKIPLGTWVLIAFAGIHCVVALRRGDGPTLADQFILLAPAATVFILVSSQTGFSHHFRYVLPCFPFLFIWISQLGSRLASLNAHSAAIAAALLWSVGSSLWYYPHSLSYFNELAGGPLGGRHHLINSNIDWGQDLVHLRDWLNEHPEARPLRLAYYGYFDPPAIGIESQRPPHRPMPDSQGVIGPVTIPAGYYAVSVNYLHGYPWQAHRDAYSYFQDFEPVARAGYSIYIYHIPEETEAAPPYN